MNSRASRRPRRLRRRLRVLYISDILAWADTFHAKRRRWPRRDDGPVDDAPDLTWCAIDQALRKGGRGLPTRSGWSLAQLLAGRRGVRMGDLLHPAARAGRGWFNWYHSARSRSPSRVIGAPLVVLMVRMLHPEALEGAR